MKRRSTLMFSAAMALGGLLAFAARPAAAQYSVVFLTPTGFKDTFAFAAGNGAQVGTGYGTATGGNSHAMLWRGTASSYMDLNPAGFSGSFLYGTNGLQQVGTGFTGPETHAIVWNGSADNYTDLNPANFDYSFAYAVDNGHQVGGGRNPSAFDVTHALLWNNTAAGFVDLHPGPDYDDSTAQGVHGNTQVGVSTYQTLYHAMLWHGTAASFVDLHPDGYDESVTTAAWDNEQVGQAYGTNTGGPNHAILWHGSATGITDIHPTGYTASFLSATNGTYEAGVAVLNGDEHAMVWTGTAASAVDLHKLLPAMFQITGITSNARGVDVDGSVVGTVYDGVTYFAVRWVPIAPPLLTVNGRLALEGVNDLSAVKPAVPLGTFHIEFRSPGTTTVVKSADVSLTPVGAGSPYGTFAVPAVTGGVYDIAIKGNKSLRVVLRNVVVGIAVNLPAVLLPGGDANGDNTIDIADFGILVNAYNGDNAVTGSSYDAAADFDDSGVVDIADFGILVNEYSNTGAL